MSGEQDAELRMTPARSGRPRRSKTTFRRGETVRVEVRLPASVAAALYARADQTSRPVSVTAADLLAGALSEPEEPPLP